VQEEHVRVLEAAVSFGATQQLTSGSS
jgi:hypothetical protein